MRTIPRKKEKTPKGGEFSVKFGRDLVPLEEVKDMYISHALEVCDGDKALAAKSIGVSVRMIYNRLDRKRRKTDS